MINIWNAAYFNYTGGPFPDEESFNTFILDFTKATPKAIRAGIASRMPCNHRLVFSHADLSQHNVIVQDNKIVGLIDWLGICWLVS